MEQRVLGKTERQVSVIGLGTWQIGGAWGDVSEPDALGLLEASVDAGVTFFDTADVYGDGRSEKLIGRFLAANPWSGVTVATKMGRALEQVPENYVLSNFRRWVDRSRRNLGVDRLDLVQLHCPPTVVFSSDEVYDALTTLVEENLIEAYGVSVETCDQALTAISRRGTATVQIILNAFRLKPLEFVLPAAAEAGVGIIARVPLASGLLSGKYTGRHRVRSRRPPHLPTATVRRSTSARPSPAWTTGPVSRRPWRSPSWSPTCRSRRRRRRPRWRGSSSSRA